MEETKYTQQEILNLTQTYNTTDRKIIKQNLRRILVEHGLERKDIIELGFASPNVYAWTGNVANNIPMLDQALTIACAFDFDVQEFLREI